MSEKTVALLRVLKIAALIVLLTLGVGASADEVIRIMASNTSSGTGQDYNGGEGNRIFQGLHPDIALVQEMNYLTNSAANFRSWVDANFGSTFSYVRGTTGSIPNGIVSRYPILASGTWDDTTLTDREFIWARIDIPGEKDLWAISVHLKASSGSTNSSQRNSQAQQLLAYIAANVPASDYLVIGGDFNTYSRTEPCITTLSSVFATAGPWPADASTLENTNSGRSEPYDWVLPDADLNARKTTLVVGANAFPNGLVFDSRVYTPLSAVTPVLAADSGATGMQHMAVIRAFLIPSNAAPLIAGAAHSASPETVTDPDTSVYEIVRGTSVGLSVTATDDGGEPALKYTWSATGGAVAFSANGTNAAKTSTATFPAIGNYTLTVTAQDLPGLSVTSSVKVRVVQTAASLALTPPSATLAVNSTQAFSASLLDQYNQTMTGAVTWSASGGGTISPSGVFTATTAGGPYVLSATSGGLSRPSSVTVTRAFGSVSLGNLNQTYDGAPKPVSVTTTPAGRAVSILYGTSPTPPINAGTYAVTATLTDANYQGGSSATLTIAPDPWALWKNTYFSAAEQAAGLASDSADPDSDDLSNLAEFALGTNPRQFTAPLSGVRDAAGVSLIFTRPANLPGIRYTVETSADLLTGWSAVPLEILTPGLLETVRARVLCGADPSLPGFLRLRIERQ